MEPMEALHEIVAADRAARTRYAAAQQENDGFAARLEELRRELTKQAREQAEKEVASAREASVASAGEALAALDKECEAAIADMKAKFAAGKDACVETLFRAAVGLDD